MVSVYKKPKNKQKRPKIGTNLKFKNWFGRKVGTLGIAFSLLTGSVTPGIISALAVSKPIVAEAKVHNTQSKKKIDLDKRHKSSMHLLRASKNHYSLRYVEKLLQEKSADVNAADEKGRTPLVYAVINDDFEMMKYFIESGADIHPALHYAIKNKKNKAALFLLHQMGKNKKNLESTYLSCD